VKKAAVALAAALAALTFVVAAGAAEPPIRLTEASGGAFPKRVWVLSLPAGQRIQQSQVGVTENGRGVVDLNVAPTGTGASGASGASGSSSGTALVIDASDSMKGAPIEGALKAAQTFAAQRNVNQKIAVLTFNASTDVATPFTSSQTDIRRAVTQQPTLRYGTHLYDAVAQAVSLIGLSGVQAGSIVVLSDGADTGSKIDLEHLTQTAKKANVRVYTVAFRSKTFRPVALQRLSEETGGSFSRANSPEELAAIYNRLGLELAHEYLVSYNSTIVPGKPVKVAVAVKGVGTADAGYKAPVIPIPNAVYHPSWVDRIWQSPWTMVAFGVLIPLLVAAAFLIPYYRRRSTVRARVSDYVSMPGAKREHEALVSRVFVGTERTLERTRWWARFKNSVEFAEIPIAPVYIVVGTVILTLLVAWILSYASGVLALIALLVPVAVKSSINGRIARKRRLFGDQLPDNLDVLASGLRAGHSLVGAFAVVVNDAPEPSRSEFQRVVADEQLGVPLEDALGRVSKRMKSRDVEQVALVASVQTETGGNAAEVLDRVTESIRERQELRRLVRTLTAQGRLARWIVSLLPVGLLVFISIVSNGYMKPLFTHTSGRIVLAVAALMVIAGSVAIGRIVDIKV
jgi:tight adherence protein B